MCHYRLFEGWFKDGWITFKQISISKYVRKSSFLSIFTTSHRRCSIKKAFLEMSQNSQKNTCARVSFLIRSGQDWACWNIIQTSGSSLSFLSISLLPQYGGFSGGGLWDSKILLELQLAFCYQVSWFESHTEIDTSDD